MPGRPIIALVDDDESVRESLPPLLALFELDVLPFSSAEHFLAADVLEKVECLILDVVLPGMSGLELQQELAQRGVAIPVVLITACSLEHPGLQAGRTAAAACLPKPFSETEIVEAVQTALALDKGG